MNVITIDLEMNQPSGKIIQLGYCIHNVKTGHRIRRCSIFVNPQEPLNPEITILTGITEIEIEKYGETLKDAYNYMVKEMKDNSVGKHPIEWGLDHFELRNQLNIEWDDYVFSRRGIDVKSLYQAYAMSRPQGKTVAGLAKALEVLGSPFEGEQHRAMIDAENTFKAFKLLTNKMVKYDEIEKAVKR